MRLLLDTNAALWWLSGSRRLTRAAHEAITGAEAVYVSAVSVMEIAIGKMRDVVPAEEFVTELEASGFRLLGFDARDAIALAELPRLHPDPYDRALAAQAQRRKLTLVTSDGALAAYPISLYRL